MDHEGEFKQRGHFVSGALCAPPLTTDWVLLIRGWQVMQLQNLLLLPVFLGHHSTNSCRLLVILSFCEANSEMEFLHTKYLLEINICGRGGVGMAR